MLALFGLPYCVAQLCRCYPSCHGGRSCPDDADQQLEAWLRRAWKHRKFDFGGPSFGPIDVDELRNLGIRVDDQP